MDEGETQRFPPSDPPLPASVLVHRTCWPRCLCASLDCCLSVAAGLRRLRRRMARRRLRCSLLIRHAEPHCWSSSQPRQPQLLTAPKPLSVPNLDRLLPLPLYPSSAQWVSLLASSSPASSGAAASFESSCSASMPQERPPYVPTGRGHEATPAQETHSVSCTTDSLQASSRRGCEYHSDHRLQRRDHSTQEFLSHRVGCRRSGPSTFSRQ